MSEKSVNPREGGEDDLQRKLVRRVAFAGVLIAMLLAALAFIDYLGQPAEEPVASGPTFTAPVPVAKKEVTQPVTPAAPEPPAATEEASATQPPAGTGAPAAADAPARPEVAAQPALPVAESSAPPRAASPALARTPRSPEVATPAEGTSSVPAALPSPAEPAPAPSRPASVLPPPAAVPAEPPAPPRLFSGYAVQAGVFADAQHAEELRAKLMLNGIPSTLEARVQVGPFKTRAEAEAARQKMKALGIEGILLPPRGSRR